LKSWGLRIDERSSRDGDMGGKAENLEKRGCRKKMEEKSKPAPFAKSAKGCGTASCRVTKGLPPDLTP
jgi:hypothetical protein